MSGSIDLSRPPFSNDDIRHDARGTRQLRHASSEDLMGKWALVRGASSDSVEILALAFAHDGYDIVLCAGREERFRGVAEAIRGQPALVRLA